MATNEGNNAVKLYKAAISGDWETAESLEPTTTRINKRGETALHIATAANHTRFVEKLVDMIAKSNIENLAIQTIPPATETTTTAIASRTSYLGDVIATAPTESRIREDPTIGLVQAKAALTSATANVKAAQQETAQATTVVTVARQAGDPIQAAPPVPATNPTAIASQASSLSEALAVAPTAFKIEGDPTIGRAQVATTVVTIARQAGDPIQAAPPVPATNPTAIASQASSLSEALAVAPTAFKIEGDPTIDRAQVAAALASATANVKAAQQETAQATTVVTIARQAGDPIQAAPPVPATNPTAIASQASSLSEALAVAPTAFKIEGDPTIGRAQVATTVVTIARQAGDPIQAAPPVPATNPTAIASQASSLSEALAVAPTAFKIEGDPTIGRAQVAAALASATANAIAAQQENTQATAIVTIARQAGDSSQAAAAAPATTPTTVVSQASSLSEAIAAAPTAFRIEEEPTIGKGQAAVALASATANAIAAQQGNVQTTAAVTTSRQAGEPISAAAPQPEPGNTAFCYAAISGNVKIAKIMKEKKNDLPMIRGRKGFLPVYMAALAGHAEMVRELYEDHCTKSQLKLEEDDLISLLIALVESDIYDTALKMIEHHPKLATMKDKNRQGETALHAFARKPCIPSIGTSKGIWSYCKNFFSNKRKREQGLQLVQKLWEEVILQDEKTVSNFMILLSGQRLIFIAAESGNVEFLTILIRQYPDLVLKVDDKQYTIFHIAVLHRHEKIFQLIFQLGMIKNLINIHEDAERNNMLHLAGRLPSQSRLNVIPGAALQLQHELLWFEEVKKVVRPGQIAEKNLSGQTARDVFMKEHEGLRQKAEKWMVNTANSCMLVATLIATVVFAAAFTVPGGNVEDTGIPIFVRDNLFKVFAIADAVSLAFSTSSILSFLSILTSRFSMDDFLTSLPSKLIRGLLFLFIAIITMMAAFVLAFFFIFKHGLVRFAISIAAVASIPIVLFIWQLYLVYEMIRATCMGSFLFCCNKKSLFPTKSKFPLLEKKLCCFN